VFCALLLSFGKEEMKNNRIRKRVYELLSKSVTSRPLHPSSDPRELHFVFFRKPNKFLESDERTGHVSGVRLEKTKLIGNLSFVNVCDLKFFMYFSMQWGHTYNQRTESLYYGFDIKTDDTKMEEVKHQVENHFEGYQ
jgi:hypothetical protein